MFIWILLLLITPLSAVDFEREQPNQLAQLDDLIAATEKSLKNQKLLREKVVDYLKLQKQVMADPDDVEQLYELAKNAQGVLDLIKSNHLIYSFDADFISELALTAKPAMKRGIPKASLP